MNTEERLVINKITLKANNTEVNAMIFKPAASKLNRKHFAIFTHGFTSHKASILNWAARVSEEGVACVIFDQPGHFLGSYKEVDSFDTFKEDAPKLFQVALEKLISDYGFEPEKLMIGGHSLGALTSLIALERDYFSLYDTQCLCIGFGLPPGEVTHIFSTPMYKSTLNLRGELVSKNISPEVMFPWIKEKKQDLNIANKKIHFITGEDDVVVGKEGSEKLVEYLNEIGNEATIEKPKKLAHHMPELAAAHVKKYMKDQGFFL